MDARSITANCIDEDQALGMLDGTLTSDQRRHVERHIDSCSACRELLSGLAQQSGFHDKPSAPLLPVTAEFVHLPRLHITTRHAPLTAPSEARPAAARKQSSRPPPRKPAAVVEAPAPSSTWWPILTVTLALGGFALVLLAIVLGSAGLFYAGGRLAAEAEPVETFSPVVAAPPETPTMPIAPLLDFPGVSEILNTSGGEQLFSNAHLGTIAHSALTTALTQFAFQAVLGCEVVLDDVTFRSAVDFQPLVIHIVGDASVQVTIRNSRIEGNVIVAGGARVRFEDCTIHGTITGRPILVRTRVH